MPRRARPVVFGVAVAAVAGIALGAFSVPAPAQKDTAKTLRPAADFASIKDPKARSVALFREAGKVLLHPRCLNCHQQSGIPRQGDDARLHRPPAVGGPSRIGVPGMRCGTCHGARNFDPARVPGAPHWQLAPASTGWQGLSLGQVCQQIKDRKRNGNKSIADIVAHMQKDKLVGWAWSPGVGRSPAPGTHAAFSALIAAWAGAGAHCPPD